MAGVDRRATSIGRVQIVISGSYREAGREYGQRYDKDIKCQIDAYDAVFDVLGMDREMVAQRAEEKLLPATQRAFPDYVDELRGRAEGAGVAFRHLFPLNCIEEVWSWVGPEKMAELEAIAARHNGQDQCTTFALRQGGHTLIGHNEDWSAVDLETTMLMHDVTVPSGTRFLSLQFVGLIPWSGLNSHGLAITANTLPATDAIPGAANAFVLRRVLECRTLEEVWDCVRTRYRGSGTYVLAADAQGRAWAMETSARRAACRSVEDWTAETNHFTEQTMVPLRAEPVSEDSLGRLARAQELISSGMQEDADALSLARQVLMDHRALSGRAICGHPDSALPEPLQMATIATTIYEPTEGHFRAALAPPCEHELELFDLPRQP